MSQPAETGTDPSRSETSGAEERRGRVLVIDDEPALGRALRRSLAAEHDVVVVESGREGLEVLRRDAGFDAIFCDLLMPEMTGMEFHDALRRELPALSERVVFMTGCTFTPHVRDFLAHLSNVQIEKPVDIDRVRKLVRDRVQARRSARRRQAAAGPSARPRSRSLRPRGHAACNPEARYTKILPKLHRGTPLARVSRSQG